jgi:hypothetical protein
VAICTGCPVVTDCLVFGSRPGPNVEFGVYGGTEPDERGRKQYLASMALDRLEEMRSLRDQGMTYEAIGTLYGMARQSVHEALAQTA